MRLIIALLAVVAAYGQVTVKQSGGVSRNLLDKAKDVVNIKDFGAKCDGATDDSAAIQTAASLGVLVWIPAGTCVHASTVTINAKSSQFQGVGQSSILYYTGSGKQIHVTGLSIQVAFRDIKFRGNANATNAIYVDAAELLTVIEHCFFTGFSNASASDIELRTNNAEINFNYFADGNRAIHLKNMGGGFGAQAVNVRGNTFGSLIGYATEYVLSEMPNNRFIENSFNGGTPIQLHINGGNAQIIRDNYFEGASNCLVKIENASQHLIQANLFWGISITPYAIRATNSVGNVYLNNYFDDLFTTARWDLPLSADPYSVFLSGQAIPSSTPQFGLVYGYDSASPGNVMRMRAIIGQTRNLLELQNENGVNTVYATQDGKAYAIRGFWSLSGASNVESRNCFGRTATEQCIVGNAVNAGYFGDSVLGEMLFVQYNTGKGWKFGDGNANATKFAIDGSGNVSSAGGMTVGTGGSAGKAVCFKVDGKTLGYCSTVVAADGSCTCN